MTVFDDCARYHAKLEEGDEELHRDTLAFAMGVLLGSKYAGCAAAVALAWERAYPGVTLPDIMDTIIKRGFVAGPMQ